MKTLALFNLKGGVGKTVSAVNLAALASASGLKTLLWDLDPQGSAAWYLGVDTDEIGGMKRLARGKTTIGELIRQTGVSRLDLVAGGLSSLHLEAAQADHASLLARLTEPLSEEYHLLIYDCPAGLQAINEAVLGQADAVAMPMIPTSLSVHTYEVFLRYLSKRRLSGLKLYPFLTQVDRRRRLHRDLVEALPAQIQTLLEATVPYASVVEQMGPRRLPLPLFAPKTTAGQAYAALWSELADALSHRRPG
ncbi:hypothetical protein BI364_16915 [Acidihalobacter yilgarnensis]|uniref:AAA domain-containing protein n=1 Tax=Acidihalobacter yilgarnensis TaxID=2819280 RepID=A0A1D8ISQ9_9GAMM|nr:AAA family ATPase [Acidihalobacter yilgarnensis]AOU99384.1 hypothetical protein BI364_16915 [Acidihalobacter yilgarnensis]